MADLAQLEARMKALEQKISPIANQTVHIAAIMKKANVVVAPPSGTKGRASAPIPSPLDQAQVKSEAEALVEELIAAYSSADSVSREKIRKMLAENPSF